MAEKYIVYVENGLVRTAHVLDDAVFLKRHPHAVVTEITKDEYEDIEDAEKQLDLKDGIAEKQKSGKLKIKNRRTLRERQEADLAADKAREKQRRAQLAVAKDVTLDAAVRLDALMGFLGL